MQIAAITWNLFHGRDWPPEPELQLARHRFSGRPIRGDRYVQVNRDLSREFAAMIAAGEWQIGLFQECPPRWKRSLARQCRADAQRVLTARNWLLPLTSLIGAWRPDFIGASEGGSNLTLVRPAAGEIAERASFTITHSPERRVMALTRLDSGLCVANIHASTAVPRAEREIVVAAEHAIAFAGSDPLIFGGDFNVRPHQSDVYDRLRDRFGLAPRTGPNRLSHLLVHNLDVVEQPRALPPEARDVSDPETGLAIRLSDHHPVEASFSRESVI